MESSPSIAQINLFNDYFIDQWVDNDNIRDMWICYKEMHRTTNAVESWHIKLNRPIGKSNPHIFELITTLQKDAKYVSFAIDQLELNMTLQKRKILYGRLDTAITTTIGSFEQGIISIARCIDILSQKLLN